MPLKQNVGRIDHVAILVSPGNFAACLERLEGALGVSFVRATRKDLGLLIGIDWDAGLEILAPTGPESPLWQRLQERGEGHVSIIFGVADLESAKGQARAAGFNLGPEVGLTGEEPWAERFEVLRESMLESFCGIDLAIGEVKPRY